jgi:hypothetical protein
MNIETNIFKIENLADITTKYKTYKIIGLHPEQPEYFHNRQLLIKRLSYLLRYPVTVIDKNNQPYLVIMDGAAHPPSPYTLVRTVVNFEIDRDDILVDYSLREPMNDEICLRFLQFLVQEPLHNNIDLWHPGAGRPFFQKASSPIQSNEMNLFSGFSVRATKIPEGGLGFCIDLASKFASKNSLPSKISRNDFSRWKNKNYVYHYGHNWYEIQASGMDDRNARDYLIPINDNPVSLIKYITEQSRKPLPPELANINENCSVVTYITNRNETRAAPTELCYPIYGTEDPAVRRIHRSTILSASNRRTKILEYQQAYLKELRFGKIKVRLSDEPTSTPRKLFSVPDIQFANSKILSVRATPGTLHVSLDKLGAERKSLLREVGAYNSELLDLQYFIVPESVQQSFGEQLLIDLKKCVNNLMHHENSYDPIVITYDDWGAKTVHAQGMAIVKAVKEHHQGAGYGVVMVHHLDEKKLRQEDQLAALAIRELRDPAIQIFAAVMHSTIGRECYELSTGKDGNPFYRSRNDKRGKLNGYLENVALNKVLLTNQRWPFILATKMNADITIGIDVKQNTAGIIVVSKNGGDISIVTKTSRQKERLSGKYMKSLLVEVISKEIDKGFTAIKNIVIHRDGRVFETEISGALDAMEALIQQGKLDSDANLTIIEIPKSSPAPLRLFDTSIKNNKKEVDNPQIGTYYIADETNAYLCSTGRAFPRPGTVNPLHVKKAFGTLDIEACLEDVFYLTSLTWTRPEDCSRYPITMKLNDRYLSEDATDYDKDGFELEVAATEEMFDE